MDRLPFVVDRNDHRKRQGIRNPVEPELAAERLAQRSQEPIPALGIIGELRRSRTQSRVVRHNRRLGSRVAHIHRSKILRVSSGLTAAADRSAKTNIKDPVAVVSRKKLYDQDKRRHYWMEVTM